MAKLKIEFEFNVKTEINIDPETIIESETDFESEAYDIATEELKNEINTLFYLNNIFNNDNTKVVEFKFPDSISDPHKAIIILETSIPEDTIKELIKNDEIILYELESISGEAYSTANVEHYIPGYNGDYFEHKVIDEIDIEYSVTFQAFKYEYELLSELD